NVGINGVLYNWPAVMTEGICPTGWHVPSNGEFTQLSDFLGPSAGGKMKEGGTSNWWSPNIGATNSSGFTALPGGYLSVPGFVNENGYGNHGYWWSSSAIGTTNAYSRIIYNYSEQLVGPSNNNRSRGFSARCLKD
ncbi:MAG TPA: hypothetical protein EYQ21_05775, partial [Flavobacteriales bacterium]|nr:hypothetical protein [Flavobacteriales bacterium]